MPTGPVFKFHLNTVQPCHLNNGQMSSEHVWDQLFTVDTIWNIGETGDINIAAMAEVHEPQYTRDFFLPCVLRRLCSRRRCATVWVLLYGPIIYGSFLSFSGLQWRRFNLHSFFVGAAQVFARMQNHLWRCSAKSSNTNLWRSLFFYQGMHILLLILMYGGDLNK